jgi:hypothetical protein
VDARWAAIDKAQRQRHEQRIELRSKIPEIAASQYQVDRADRRATQEFGWAIGTGLAALIPLGVTGAIIGSRFGRAGLGYLTGAAVAGTAGTIGAAVSLHSFDARTKAGRPKGTIDNIEFDHQRLNDRRYRRAYEQYYLWKTVDELDSDPITEQDVPRSARQLLTKLVDARFAELDTNRNDKIEVGHASESASYTDGFTALDTDHDHAVNRPELLSYYEQRTDQTQWAFERAIMPYRRKHALDGGELEGGTIEPGIYHSRMPSVYWSFRPS